MGFTGLDMIPPALSYGDRLRKNNDVRHSERFLT
jgi:hypothetical protein